MCRCASITPLVLQAVKDEVSVFLVRRQHSNASQHPEAAPGELRERER